ncbi:anthranilate synthase component II [Moraxella bovis]|uniref:Anthranilate synthase component II n=1 Tax=Moraxella bovis TaxID=476 RepID=A0A1T0A0D9_MORBO|nr:aminodeoxychorismate/anthranilate synthase component II [Moraxella bovis]AWY19924.1 aminodeoxychorismate/anthranilate synthase component II [Moraxella bovis]OOR89194.1 anthranilate/aminodeoxychorismate synthase component II [Moraxella bovis]UYZ74953.1 aminodeoxychorismate/anthranilate synthase component II [Moraxella bovis]UYZ79116.1 aminodeoxychorismate/anthranilate synthase component II [Moraxella bovis]UYZ80297.1 aminodeoxychorismate/anthranilate synthase component II [Moraxella bovis]
MLLMIDNYCSFTYNIVQYFGELKQDIVVKRNNEITIDEITALAPQAIILGPGPCTPTEAGVTVPILTHFGGQIPILGVCLGHQAIGQAFGGNVVRAGEVMHGRLSDVYHKDMGVFHGLPKPVSVVRYHSLVIDKATLPECLEITAWTQNADSSMGEIMGVRHKELDIEGVQFHPESILSEHGYQLFNNFLKRCGLAVLDDETLPTVA